MKKTFKLQDLECANCAAKMEAAVKGIEGVEDARVNFMSQSFMLEAPDDRFEAILKDASKKMRIIEPDVRVLV